MKPHKLFQPYYSVEFGENDSNFIVTTRPHNVEESCFDTYSVSSPLSPCDSSSSP